VTVRSVPFSRSAARRLTGALPPLVIALCAMVAALCPAAGDILQFDRARILSGQWYRLLTGHLTHFTASHLAWDLGVFIGLGLIAGAIDGRGTAVTLALAAVAIPLGVLQFQPALQTYRGLSGLDSALFVFLVCRQLWVAEDGLGTTGLGLAWAPFGCLVVFGAKVVFECVTGRTLFVSGAGTFTAVPLAHAVGGACGAAVGLIWQNKWILAVLPANRGVTSP